MMKFDVTNYFIDPSNKNIKMSSFKSSENIQKKEDGPDRSVSDNQSTWVFALLESPCRDDSNKHRTSTAI